MLFTEPFKIPEYNTTSTNIVFPEKGNEDLLGEILDLADVLKTDNLSEENIDLVNGLIQYKLVQLLPECDCDDADAEQEIDFTGKTIEEMFQMTEG